MTLRIDVITLFPGLFPGPLAESIPGAPWRLVPQRSSPTTCARGASVVTGASTTTRTAAAPGMLLRPEPVAEALDAVAPAGLRRDPHPARPRRPARSTRRAPSSSRPPAPGAVCPRYEGIDDRVRSMVDLELSIGDYVLSGGEIPALVVIDAMLRLLPGVIDAASPTDESFADGLLEYPQYTRPAEFRGMSVPDVLLSGHHGEVERWRREQALERTGGCGRTCWRTAPD